MVVQQQRPIAGPEGHDEALRPGQITKSEAMPGEFESGDVISGTLLKYGKPFHCVDDNIGIQVITHQLPPAGGPDWVGPRASRMRCSYSVSPSCSPSAISSALRPWNPLA